MKLVNLKSNQIEQGTGSCTPGSPGGILPATAYHPESGAAVIAVSA